MSDDNRRKLLTILAPRRLRRGRSSRKHKRRRVWIGWLNTDSCSWVGNTYAFKEARGAGVKEGSQVVIEERWANGRNRSVAAPAKSCGEKACDHCGGVCGCSARRGRGRPEDADRHGHRPPYLVAQGLVKSSRGRAA